MYSPRTLDWGKFYVFANARPPLIPDRSRDPGEKPESSGEKQGEQPTDR